MLYHFEDGDSYFSHLSRNMNSTTEVRKTSKFHKRAHLEDRITQLKHTIPKIGRKRKYKSFRK